MLLILDHGARVTRLEQRPAPTMTNIERARVSPIHNPHRVADIASAWLHDEMVVRVHQTDRVQAQTPADRDATEPDREPLPVDVVPEDRTLVDSMCREVVDPVGLIVTWIAPHSQRVPGNVQRVCKVSDTFWCQTPFCL